MVSHFIHILVTEGSSGSGVEWGAAEKRTEKEKNHRKKEWGIQKREKEKKILAQ